MVRGGFPGSAAQNNQVELAQPEYLGKNRAEPVGKYLGGASSTRLVGEARLGKIGETRVLPWFKLFSVWTLADGEWRGQSPSACRAPRGGCIPWTALEGSLPRD